MQLFTEVLEWMKDTSILISEVVTELRRAVKRKKRGSNMSTEKALEVLFEEFDEDKDKEISHDEFNHVLTNLGLTLSEKEFARMMRIFDEDQNGSLDYEEFIFIVMEQDVKFHSKSDEPLVQNLGLNACFAHQQQTDLRCFRCGEMVPVKSLAGHADMCVSASPARFSIQLPPLVEQDEK